MRLAKAPQMREADDDRRARVRVCVDSCAAAADLFDLARGEWAGRRRNLVDETA